MADVQRMKSIIFYRMGHYEKAQQYAREACLTDPGAKENKELLYKIVRKKDINISK